MDTEKINENLQRIVESLGYEFVGVEIDEEEGTQVLRLYADRENGINIDDCEKISKAVDEYLDADDDIFEGNYLLEVSSPGVERPLFKPSDYARFAGSPVSVKLKEPVSGRRRLNGNILWEKDSLIGLDCDGERTELPFEKIASAHLVYVHQKGQKKTFEKKGGKK